MSRDRRRALARRFVAVAGLLRADRIGEAQATALDAQVELDWLAGGDQLVRGAQPRWQWEWTVWLAAAVTVANAAETERDIQGLTTRIQEQVVAAGRDSWLYGTGVVRVDEGGVRHVCGECFMADGHLVSCSRHPEQPVPPPE